MITIELTQLQAWFLNYAVNMQLDADATICTADYQGEEGEEAFFDDYGYLLADFEKELTELRKILNKSKIG